MSGTERTLLLFDLDEVLVHPIGYNVTMRLAIEYFAGKMGLEFSGPTDQDIAAFHAYGMTNEWLSGGLSLAAVISAATNAQPGAIRPTLAATIEALRESGIKCPRPDFAALARAVYERYGGNVHISEPVIDEMRARSLPDAYPVLDEILSDIRPPKGPFALIYQQLVLGDKQFSEVYGLPADIECESYLALDRPLMLPEVAEKLWHVLETDHCGAVVFTARPSLPPKELTPEEMSAVDRKIHPPETELAVDVAGLHGLPVTGAGRMAWLALRNGKPIDAYTKPSFVQALAAIAAARTGEERASLEAAAQLAEGGSLSGPLAQVAAEQTHVIVFEDSSGGIRAVRQAVELLKETGAQIRVSGIGIAYEPVKQQILAQIADRVAPDINAGLSPILDSLM